MSSSASVVGAENVSKSFSVDSQNPVPFWREKTSTDDDVAGFFSKHSNKRVG